jgi:hypothetical protein
VPCFHTLARLLELDGTPLPRAATEKDAWRAIERSPWLSFGVGLAEATSRLEREAAAEEFLANFTLWMGYRGACIELAPPGRRAIYLRLDGDDASATHQALTLPPPLVVLTAWNPTSAAAALDPAINRGANRRLLQHLDERDLSWWPAVNAPATRFAEESFAIFGLSYAEGFALAEGFGQRAIYQLEGPSGWLVARRAGRVQRWRGRLSASAPPHPRPA